MGYIAHRTIIVTSFDITWDEPKLAETARKKAIEIFGEGLVSDMVDSVINGYKSFFVAPDGSKEGWPESDEGDVKREEFKKWLREQAYDDGSNHYDWAEFRYGGDERELATIVDYNGKEN